MGCASSRLVQGGPRYSPVSHEPCWEFVRRTITYLPQSSRPGFPWTAFFPNGFRPVPRSQRFVFGTRPPGMDFVQDIAWPYMLSDRTPPDTLFIVFEGDFRFWPEDCLEPADWLRLCDRPADDQAGGQPHLRGFAVGERRDSDASLVSPELFDIVSICNQAHRAKAPDGRHMGDIVWLSWNAAAAGTKGPTKRWTGRTIYNGSTAIAYTKAGATALAGLARDARPEHYDLWLRDKVFGTKITTTCASYVVPPIGGYTAHASPNLGGAVRRGNFGEWWNFPGAGRETGLDNGPRYLQPFLDGENRPPAEGVRHPLRFGLHDGAWWLTDKPPTDVLHWGDDGLLAWLLTELGWVTDDFPRRWCGPVKGSRKGDALDWRLLVEQPTSVREPQQRKGKGASADAPVVQLPRFVAWLVSLHHRDIGVVKNAHNTPITERWRRTRSIVHTLYLRRKFREDGDRPV